MANVKISDLTAYASPASTDVVPIVDLVNDATKKVTVANLVSAVSSDIALNSDGSASFAGGDLDINNSGNVRCQRSGSAGYIDLNSTGILKAQGAAGGSVVQVLNQATNGVTASILGNGDASFTGAVSKGSGSFKINHPLPSKTETHHLIHSFIEGPQADLMYRGYVDLVDGQATVNIDTAARMTEGTFEVLCTNVSCFTSNESDWTAIKGSVTGNVLTITAQDATATSKVAWMVVGERKDQHMLDTDWTDATGRVITEPEKVI